ncbi:MAG: VWA domain-containing protein [Gammaproteobacteria bacterium]|nr:VWA domain-containing protein [Gammaproteobacteria bacterium]
MTIYYVYAENEDGTLLVGPNTRGVHAGMVDAEHTVPWKQNIVLSFEDPAHRDRVLFFSERDKMLQFMTASGLEQRQASVYAAIDQGSAPPFQEVIAVEPDTFVDIRKQLYLLPILAAEEPAVHKIQGRRIKSALLEVAAVTKNTPPAKPPASLSARVNPNLEDYRTAVVFVVDASGSMQRDIDSTREAAVELLESLQRAGLSDKVRFGLIGFRDDPEAVRGVGYLTRMFVDPAKADSAQKFLAGAQQLAASPVSTRSWAEDGLAGIQSALNDVDWEQFGGRYIVYMSDASLRGATADGDTPASATASTIEDINALAIEKGVAIYSYHILTRAARQRGDIEVAKAQMEAVSRYPGAGSLYYGVASARDSEVAYRSAVQQLANDLIQHVREATSGQAVQPVEQGSTAGKPLTIAQKNQAVGRAMQLRYLGSSAGTTAPSMFHAWAMELSPRSGSWAFSVRLLITKDQLSDLRDTVQEIYNAAIESEFDPQAFLPSISSLALKLGRDPKIGKSGYATRLEDTELLEFLEDLPYKSRAMELIAEDAWLDLEAAEVLSFTDSLLSKVKTYQRLHDDADNWTQLHRADEPGDAVYPMPLTLLP